MTMNKKIMIGLAVAAVIGIGTYAFGHMGGGYGFMHEGPGMHYGYYGAPGYDYGTNLDDKGIKALEEERSAFLRATDGIRQNLYAKELELKSELAKKNPDATKAREFQKEINGLESKLDQMRIDQMIKVRKLNPNAAGTYMMGGYHMGYGYNSPADSCWR